MTGGRRRPALPPVPRPGLAAPRVRVGLGAAVPGAVVRLAPAVLATATGWLAGADGMGWIVLAGLVVLLVLRPALPTVAGVVLLAGFATLAGPDLLARADPAGTPAGGPALSPAGVLGPLRLGLLALLLDATLRISALAPHVAWPARVEVGVLTLPGRSVLRTQAVVQPVLWLAHALRTVGPGATGDEAGGAIGGEVGRLLGLVAVLGLLALLAARPGPASGHGP